MPTLLRPQDDDPAATRRTIGQSFDMIEKAEPWHQVGGTGEPAFENSWVNFAGAAITAGFRKDVMGNVWIKGTVKNGTVPATVFTLPVGYRPEAQTDFAIVEGAGGMGRLIVKADGTVVAQSGNNATYSLNVCFRAV